MCFFSVLLALRLSRLGKRELVLFVRLFDLRLFGFVRFLWEGLRFVIVALPGLFSYHFFLLLCHNNCNIHFRMDSSISTHWTRPFPVEGLSGIFSFLFLPCFIQIRVFNGNSVDLYNPSRACTVSSGHLFSIDSFYIVSNDSISGQRRT